MQSAGFARAMTLRSVLFIPYSALCTLHSALGTLYSAFRLRSHARIVSARMVRKTRCAHRKGRPGVPAAVRPGRCAHQRGRRARRAECRVKSAECRVTGGGGSEFCSRITTRDILRLSLPGNAEASFRRSSLCTLHSPFCTLHSAFCTCSPMSRRHGFVARDVARKLMWCRRLSRFEPHQARNVASRRDFRDSGRMLFGQRIPRAPRPTRRRMAEVSAVPPRGSRVRACRQPTTDNPLPTRVRIAKEPTHRLDCTGRSLRCK
jgi:hypothetical protein